MGPGSDPPAELEVLRKALLEWYAAEHREFPWRETTDPYPILVAEVMSQQTQLDRIVDAWQAFLDRWPSISDLAAADQAAVVGFWTDHNLGYNNRARYLNEAAELVIEEFDGVMPDSPSALQKLPGVGPYTANAVASFAFNNGNAVVDTNVKRVLYRAFNVKDDSDSFARTAGELMPPDDSRAWNNAIMELGGTVCKKNPECDTAECPWRPWCHAYRTGDFTAPDVPTQPAFDGSRRQFRGRVIAALNEAGPLGLDAIGSRIRVDYTPEGEGGREWLLDLLEDLADDGLVTLEETNGELTARLVE